MHTLSDFVLEKVGIAPDQRGAGTTNGAGINRQGYDKALIILSIGETVATAKLDVKVQESSDDGSTDAYADITGAVFTQISDAVDNTIRLMDLDLRDAEEYIRVVGVVTDANVDYGVVVLLYNRSGALPPTHIAAVIQA